MAQTESTLQMALATDPNFLRTLQYHLVMAARVVLSESGVGGAHGDRANYARIVITSPAQATANAAPMVVGGVNLIGTVTIDGAGKATTSATDAAIFAQVNTFLNALAGIDTGD